jgi:ferredoxin--NADP+ reductase
MTHVIFDLCTRVGDCVAVCPVECIVDGEPEEEWPWYYIDPDTCIDCGACVPACPEDAIRPLEDLPAEYVYAAELNALFFTEGPGYTALEKGKEHVHAYEAPDWL